MRAFRSHVCFAALALALAGLPASGVHAQPGAKPATVLENDYVTVSRNIAPCATATPDKCGDRAILAMGEITLASGAKKRVMQRAEIAVFGAGHSYEVAVGSPFFEIAIKPKHPPVRAPAER